MFTKSILFALLAACGVQSSSSPDEPLGGDPDANARAAAAARDFLDKQMQTQRQLHNASTEPPSEQPDKKPPDDDQMDQHFCCQSVDLKNFSGEGCQTIGQGQIDLCTRVLYCPGKWAKDEGKVVCA
jgi:hypothetical protein